HVIESSDQEIPPILMRSGRGSHRSRLRGLEQTLVRGEERSQVEPGENDEDAARQGDQNRRNAGIPAQGGARTGIEGHDENSLPTRERRKKKIRLCSPFRTRTARGRPLEGQRGRRLDSALDAFELAATRVVQGDKQHIRLEGYALQSVQRLTRRQGEAIEHIRRAALGLLAAPLYR